MRILDENIRRLAEIMEDQIEEEMDLLKNWWIYTDKKMEIFKYEGGGVITIVDGKEIRTIVDGKGDPWWLAKDICDILELSDVSMSVNALNDDEKMIQTLFVSGQNREIWVINESGLYSLLIKYK